MNTQTTIISAFDRDRIAVEARMSSTSVKRVYLGLPVGHTTWLRVDQAARALGLLAPPPSAAASNLEHARVRGEPVTKAKVGVAAIGERAAADTRSDRRSRSARKGGSCP